MEAVNSASSATTGRNCPCQPAIAEPVTMEASASGRVRSRRLTIQAFVGLSVAVSLMYALFSTVAGAPKKTGGLSLPLRMSITLKCVTR